MAFSLADIFSSSLSSPRCQFEGVELVDQHPHTIDQLLEQMDHFPEGLWLDLELLGEG